MKLESTLRNRIFAIAGLAAAAALAAGLAGCRVHTEKGANGEDQKVQIDTPFSSIHVNTGHTTAADLGLPVYPGAQLAADKDNDKSADVHMGFGEWQLRVKVVNYTTPDSQDKVVAFYKQALGRFGTVIACQDSQPVGSPTATAEGLTCNDKDSANVKNGTSVKVNKNGASYGYSSDRSGFQLKAGSRKHQHVVGFESSAPGQTRFSLVAVDLPTVVDNSGKSD